MKCRVANRFIWSGNNHTPNDCSSIAFVEESKCTFHSFDGITIGSSSLPLSTRQPQPSQVCMFCSFGDIVWTLYIYLLPHLMFIQKCPSIRVRCRWWGTIFLIYVNMHTYHLTRIFLIISHMWCYSILMPFIYPFIHENQNYKIHHLLRHKTKSEFMLLCDVYFKIFIEFKCPCILYVYASIRMNEYVICEHSILIYEWMELFTKTKTKHKYQWTAGNGLKWIDRSLKFQKCFRYLLWLWACNLIICTCLLVFLCVCGCQPWHSNELSGILSTISSYRISAKSPFKQYHFIAGFR